jgi:acetyl esterase/lipase
VSAELEVWPGAVHGFLQMTRDVALARIALANGARFLSLKCQSG